MFNSECPAGSFCGDGTCQVECTVDEPCASGQACTSFGMCVMADTGGGDPDAGSPGVDAGRDAGSPAVDGGRDAAAPSDAGHDAFDSRPACVIAGGTDADGDGYCVTGADADCDDARASANPEETEMCTPQTALRADRAIDEDCDGAIDETCPWHFGTPHAVELQAFDQTNFPMSSPRLSGDGLRLYLPGGSGPPPRPALVLTRTALDQPFGAPQPVGTVATSAPFVQGLEVSRDQREAYFQASVAGAVDLYRATRSSPTDPFSALTIVTELSTAGRDTNPALRADGLEILYLPDASGARVMHRATRASTTASWGTPTPITLEGGVPSFGASPSLSEDGLTLFYAAGVTGGTSFYRASRPSLDATTFEDPVEITAFDAAGHDSLFPAVYERDAEVYFTSDRPFAQPFGATGLWRARICRDAPCVDTPIACPSTVRSPDGLHCYTAGAAGDYAAGVTACEGMGSRMVEIDSQAEHDLIWSLFGGTASVWIGLEETATPEVFAWASGAAVVYANWQSTEPSPGVVEPNAFMFSGYAGQWADVDGPAWSGVPVCESVLWPTW